MKKEQLDKLLVIKKCHIYTMIHFYVATKNISKNIAIVGCRVRNSLILFYFFFLVFGLLLKAIDIHSLLNKRWTAQM